MSIRKILFNRKLRQISYFSKIVSSRECLIKGIRRKKSMMKICIYCSGSYFENSLMLEIERECTKKYILCCGEKNLCKKM